MSASERPSTAAGGSQSEANLNKKFFRCRGA
jgi:hypothetical protein